MRRCTKRWTPSVPGEGKLTIGLTCSTCKPVIRGHAASDHAFAAISLTDTGAGIETRDLERIFEPFFTTKDVGKGTGLGLSQVFGFAKQSGGDVDVRSTPGVGTTFTLYLPRAERDTEADATVSLEERLPGTSDLSILIVEDNEEVGRFASEALSDMGYRTLLVTSAEDALDRLETDGGRFDVVFSDVVMPGMGGLELAKRLRQILPHLPVILASGYSHVLAQEGAHGFPLLQKPYSTEQLARAIDALILRDVGGA